MKRRDFLGRVILGGVGLAGLSTLNPHLVFAGSRQVSSGEVRVRELIDFDWRFHLGDVRGGQAVSYNDSDWRVLDLPHDWSIEGKIEKSNPSSWHGAYLPGGIGWYRKELQWNSSWEGRKAFIDFDGIFMNSDVWINGIHLGHWPYGFTTFRYELTPHLVHGTNFIAVRVNNSKQPSARWYTGSGIYRHVWLNILNPVYVDHWGTFVTTPQITGNSAVVRISTEIANTTGRVKSIAVEQTIRNRAERIVARSVSPRVVDIQNKVKVSQDLIVYSPELWSPDAPNMYTVETALREGNKIVDRYLTPLGIRKVEVSPQWGFRLNDEPMMIKGVANHEDAGGAVGSAIPDDILYYRLKKVKEMGCNAIRTAHNPHQPELATFCDVLGIMILDEAFDTWAKPKRNSKYDYGLYFKKWWKKDLGHFVRRDRNHPSVIMWSIGNEVNGYTNEWQERLVNFVRVLDPTRPVTQARGWKGPYIDVAGFNSEGEKIGVIRDFHEGHPDKPVLGTEMPHTRQTRGVYRTQSRHPNAGKKGFIHAVPDLSEEEVFAGIPKIYCSSYDNDFMYIDVRDQYKQNKRYPFLMGSFRWTGYGYLGEANDRWPTRSKDKGVFDLGGMATDHYFLYKSLWTAAPMVHILPHWTHPGLEGVKIPVVAYSNCKTVELFLNGKSMGEQGMDENLQLVWQVPYHPGKLLALAKDDNGIVMAETSQQTAGPAYELLISPDRTTIGANRRDVVRLEITVADKDGIPVPQADNLVQFDVNGPGRLIGVENGDVGDLSATKFVKTRKAFMGKCIGLVQATDKTGDVRITVRSGNLQPATLRVISL